MGRHAEGWKVIWRRGIAYVRFTHAQTRHIISTGERDPDAAGVQAARIYAETVKDSGKRKSKGVVRSLAPLRETLAEWVASLHGTLDTETVDTYELYAFKHFAAFFATLGEATDETRIEAYGVARLRAVLRPTVRKEMSALHGFVRWCKLEGLISALPPWPELPSKSKGTRAGKQRQKANQLSPAQVEAFIGALPMWSERKDQRGRGTHFPVRPRYIIAYQTGLRPATLDAADWEDWKGTTLTIDDEDDKARFGRNVPLSAIAVEELTRLHAERGAPTSGPIFGRHDYRAATTKACVKAGIDLKIAPYDFRHARGTHLVDDGASLSGVAFLLGHTQVTTTNKYAKGSQRAAEAALVKGAPAPVDAEPELGGIVGAVPLGDTPCDPTPRARGTRRHVRRETRVRGMFTALVKAAPAAARRPGRSRSGSILEPLRESSVRRRGLEPLRELPHWNLKPVGHAETREKQACRHFRSNQKDAGKRPESHRSGSGIRNSSIRFRIPVQTQALTQASTISTPTKEGNDAHERAPQTYPAGHEGGNKPANLLGGDQAVAAELVSASEPGGQAGSILTFPNGATVAAFPVDDEFASTADRYRLVNESGLLGPEADREHALALCAGADPAPWPWGPARRFRIEGPNVIRLADGPPAIGGAT